MSKNKDFFRKQTENNIIKTEIVTTYFPVWASKISKTSNMLFYFDLFSGPGKCEDGAFTTPIKILDIIDQNPWMYNRIKMYFYEGDKTYYEKLVENINNHPVYNKLINKPIISHEKIDQDFYLKMKEIVKPGSFSFIDPFGYKEISLDLLDVMSKDWGCDCLFYLSISGLVRNINEKEKIPKIKKFFGTIAYEKVINAIKNIDELESMSNIVFNEVVQALKKKRSYFVVKFNIEFDKVERDSHYLVFLSKNKIGFKIMRDIMITRSQKDVTGLPIMTFSKRKKEKNNQLELTSEIITNILNNLCEQLLKDFKGEISVKKLFDDCLKKSYPFQDAHIRIALKQLLNRGLIYHKGIKKNKILNSNIIIFK